MLVLNRKGLIFIFVNGSFYREQRCITRNSSHLLRLTGLILGATKLPRFQVAEDEEMAPVTGHHQAMTDQIDTKPPQCCSWKGWLGPPGSTTLWRGSGSLWIGADCGDSITEWTSQGLVSMIGCGVVSPTGGGVTGLSLCSGFAEVCKLSFL